ncbi:MAG: hypothetical protein ACE5GZ_05375 [Gammaproteobacteria bacterium]
MQTFAPVFAVKRDEKRVDVPPAGCFRLFLFPHDDTNQLQFQRRLMAATPAMMIFMNTIEFDGPQQLGRPEMALGLATGGEQAGIEQQFRIEDIDGGHSAGAAVGNLIDLNGTAGPPAGPRLRRDPGSPSCA